MMKMIRLLFLMLFALGISSKVLAQKEIFLKQIPGGHD